MPHIAYFGPPGTFTEEALARLEASGAIDGPVTRISATSPPAALELVRAGKVEFACVPIESSVEGPVPPTLDALAVGQRLQIVRETELEVSFTILTRPGVTIEQVRSIGAYPVALAQVRDWLDKHLPDVEVLPASSNAGAAEDVVARKVDAAVSTALAGRRLGLDTIADGVADVDGARTRFVLVGHPCAPPARSGVDRTSVILDLHNEPGALVQAMTEISMRGIDLTRIESRPTRTGLGTYRFYLDFIGHIDDSAVAQALMALHGHARSVRYLGSWPTASAIGAVPPSGESAAEWLERIREGNADE